ncbi:DNA sulfur modification protein DndD [Methylocaldum sp.]|uniref:DNA sulfur modification protein DndD n=1 Tax=Methylocaldum sp. TaxID=1969727 RepID=UPI002D52EACA|nr:DNA sulfur modification protein DndD [Methylocaldum sp.]HYE36010.1 DNA sulfur modification protein DndD [Methylocaldum sp.]
MIFEQITIENLFSYHGKQVFNLTPADPNRNVVLIAGRNGYGKTSFINSVKLLFLGAGFGAGDELRREVQGGRKINPRAYLLGWEDEWLGVLNRKARTDPKSRYGISAVWREEQGRVSLSRSWTLSGEEVFEIMPEFPMEEDLPLRGEDADRFMETRLPARIVPFFFYDGEKVQEIAEANREGQLEQIERLLDLTLIDRLDDYLGKAIAQVRRQADPAVEFKVREKVAELAKLQAEYERIEHEMGEKDEEITETKRAIVRLERLLKGVRELALQNEESRLREKRDSLRERIEAEGQSLFDEISPMSPLLVNPELVARAVNELEKLVEHPNQKLNAQIDRILTVLPIRLFDEPPHPVPDISPAQRDFLRDRLVTLLAQYKTEAKHIRDGLFRMRSDEAASRMERMVPYQHKADTRAEFARRLRELSKLKRDLVEVEAKLNDVSNLAPEERARFMARQEELSQSKDQLEVLNQDKGRLDDQLKKAGKDVERAQKDLNEMERVRVQSRRAQLRMDLGDKLRRLFVAYRTEQRDRRRQDIEEALNRHFKVLMTSHGMIDRISLGERFEMRYHTADGSIIGMGSLSAGMKQLVAQALLWALKEVAHRAAPVIIDTPLARIDREHQERLLRHYYPAVAKQVIILPTDSELDATKYALLKPYVCREYHLENLDGESTRAIEASMYPEVA